MQQVRNIRMLYKNGWINTVENITEHNHRLVYNGPIFHFPDYGFFADINEGLAAGF